MEVQRIAKLLQPFVELDQAQLEKISAYLKLLLRWNSRINLTAVRDPEEMVTRHFGEAFFAARNLVAENWNGTAIDLGSGAGFPGMPLAIYDPAAQVTLIESQNKKAAFLNEVIRTLRLDNVNVFSGRAESFPDSAELVTMRAVEKFAKSLPLAINLVAQEGRIALMIGGSQVDEAKHLLPKVEWETEKSVPRSSARVLLVGKVPGPRT
jgi:16S rRNA (guanine527-N7)-methyltransferase